MRLVATQKFDYDKRSLNDGDKFDAPELHAKMFIASGRARKLETRVMDAEQKVEKPSEPEEEKVKGTKRGRYMRRDMRAEK